MTRAPVALAAIFVAACYDAPKPSCGFRCGPSSAACPADYTCASDNHCHRNGAPDDVMCAPPDAMPDAYSPVVIFTDPVAGAMVDPATTIRVGFDIDVVGVSAQTFTVTIAETAMPVDGAITYQPSDYRVTFERANGLPPNAELRVALTSGISDRELNPLMPTSYMFRTGPDTTPPMVTSTSPLDGATDVPVNLSVSFTLNEDVSISSITVARTSDMQAVVGVAAFDPQFKLAQFTHSAEQFAANTNYTATALVTDAAGNPTNPSPATFTFTTGPDLVKPHVLDRAPDAGETVPVNTNISVTFDEPVIVPATAFQINGAAATGTVTMSADNRTATFDPSADLPAGAQITVLLLPAITDIAGNSVGSYSFHFTTM
jgi:hypothetical protein